MARALGLINLTRARLARGLVLRSRSGTWSGYRARLAGGLARARNNKRSLGLNKLWNKDEPFFSGFLVSFFSSIFLSF